VFIHLGSIKTSSTRRRPWKRRSDYFSVLYTQILQNLNSIFLNTFPPRQSGSVVQPTPHFHLRQWR